jgi:hypothetical protein
MKLSKQYATSAKALAKIMQLFRLFLSYTATVPDDTMKSAGSDIAKSSIRIGFIFDKYLI